MFYIEIGMVLFLLLYPFLIDAQQVKHYLHYRFTVLTKANTFPEFSAVVVVDDKQIKHYSNEKRVWILTEDDWTEAPEEPPDSREWFLHQIRTLSNCTHSQCSELHVLQRIIGCELKKCNGTVTNLTAFDKYGFDGEDFIAFNSDTLQWIDKNPKAKESKVKWDQQTERNQFLHHYLKNCINWISTFNNTKKTPPVVHVFAVVALDQSRLNLTCLATGFYPRDIEMNIRLSRTNIEKQISSGIKPNDDGSFQMRTSVEIDKSHKVSCDCLVIHSSLTEPVSTSWGRTCFDNEPESLWPVIVGVAVAVVAVLVSSCWLCVNYPTVIGTAIIAASTTGLLVHNHVDEQNEL